MSTDVKMLERQLNQARTLEDRMEALSSLAWALRDTDIQRAMSLSQQLLRLAQTVPQDPKPSANAHRCLAGAYFHHGDISRALQHALESLKYAERVNDRYGLMQTRSILGSCYLTLGDYPAAQILYRQALIIAEEYNVDEDIGRLYKNIGVCMSLQGEYEEAIACYDRALPHVERLNDTGELAKIYNNYTVEYVRLNMLKEATYWANRAYEGFHQTGRWGGVIRATINLAHIHAQAGDIPRAQAYIDECIKHAENSLNLQNKQVAYQNAGEIALLAGDYQASIDWHQKALTLAEEAQAKNNMFACHEGLYKAYKATGDTARALHHHEQFHNYKERVFNESNATKWQNLEILHRTREARQEAHRQRALREADRQYFERLGAMKDDFVHSASHDLKNPLAMMKTTLYLLRRHGRVDDERGRNHLHMLDNQVNWMRDLITNVLDLAWLEMGRAIHTEMIEIVAYVRKIVEDYRHIAEEKRIRLKFETTITDLTTAIDPVQIRQMLTNLITNAIKYTPEGGEVSISISDDDDVMRFDVRDTGYGIPQSALPHLFERFYRVQDERHKSQEGTGLGLAIVKSIVEQHGGSIEVETEVDAGTCFIVQLPIVSLASTSDEDFTIDFTNPSGV